MFKKTFLYLIVLILIVILGLSSFLHKDSPEEKTVENNQQSLAYKQQPYPGEYKTVTINGVDYIQARGEVGKYGGTLYSSIIGEGPKTFNPWNAKDATSSTFGGLLFDGLTTTDAYNGRVVPKMAKSIEISSNNLEYIITLRKGLRWSDGKEITADDVVFTYNEIVKEGLGDTSARDVMMVNGEFPIVQKIDKYKIKFTTPKPFAPFLMQLSIPIAPKHILEPIVKKGKPAFEQFWGVVTPPNKFVTSGMFQLDEYVPAQRVKFKRNPNYYMIDKKSNKLPYLDNYVVFIVGDINNEILKFEAGEIDLLSVRGNQVARFKQREKHSDYKMYNLGPSTTSTFVIFNLNRRGKDGKPYVEKKKQKWFNDINFRTAVDYAIDRESLVANILSGVGLPLFTAESLPSVFLNEKLKNGHKQDVPYAKELLKKSGFKLNDKKRLIDKEGNPVEFTLMTNAGNTERESTGVMIKEDLEKLGIKTDFKPIEFNVLVGKLSDSMDWESSIMGLTGGSPFEPNVSANVWNSTGALHLFNLRKGEDAVKKADLRPWEAELDKIFEQGAMELDFNKRKQIYNKYQEIVYNERPMVYLYTTLNIYAIRNKFGNIDPTTLGGVVHNIEEVYVK